MSHHVLNVENSGERVHHLRVANNLLCVFGWASLECRAALFFPVLEMLDHRGILQQTLHHTVFSLGSLLLPKKQRASFQES